MAGENELWPEAPGVTGEILPINRAPDGTLSLAAPGMLRSAVNSAYNAMVGPGEIFTGKTPTGANALGVSPESVASDITATGFGLGAGRTPLPGALGIFGGIRAKTADLDALAEAKRLWANGETPGGVWSRTGWFQDVDKNWKFEIPDAGAFVAESAPRSSINLNSVHIPTFGKGLQAPDPNYRLGEILEHPGLYAAYPEAAKIPVGNTGFNFNVSGAYNPTNNKLSLGGGVPKDLIPVALHEVQHAIQGYEGFARGGNPQEFMREGFQKEYADVQKEGAEISDRIRGLGLNPFAVRTAIMRREQGKIGNYEAGILADFDKVLPNNGKLTNDIIQHELKSQPLAREYSDAYKKYNALSGEVESRNVEARWKAGEDPGTVPPWMTQGYPTGEQITLHEPRTNWLEPVAHDPFSQTLEPVEHDPFAGAAKP